MKKNALLFTGVMSSQRGQKPEEWKNGFPLKKKTIDCLVLISLYTSGNFILQLEPYQSNKMHYILKLSSSSKFGKRTYLAPRLLYTMLQFHINWIALETKCFSPGKLCKIIFNTFECLHMKAIIIPIKYIVTRITHWV